MLTPVYLNIFQRDVKKIQKRNLDIQLLKQVTEWLINEIPLPLRHRNHKLNGDWRGRWECHIMPDWLLIYRLENNCIVFERTGTHSDLFR